MDRPAQPDHRVPGALLRPVVRPQHRRSLVRLGLARPHVEGAAAAAAAAGRTLLEREQDRLEGRVHGQHQWNRAAAAALVHPGPCLAGRERHREVRLHLLLPLLLLQMLLRIGGGGPVLDQEQRRVGRGLHGEMHNRLRQNAAAPQPKASVSGRIAGKRKKRQRLSLSLELRDAERRHVPRVDFVSELERVRGHAAHTGRAASACGGLESLRQEEGVRAPGVVQVVGRLELGLGGRGRHLI